MPLNKQTKPFVKFLYHWLQSVSSLFLISPFFIVLTISSLFYCGGLPNLLMDQIELFDIENECKQMTCCWFLGFYGISTFGGYLMPNPFLCKSVLSKTIQFSISTQFNGQKHFYFKLFKQLYVTIQLSVNTVLMSKNSSISNNSVKHKHAV